MVTDAGVNFGADISSRYVRVARMCACICSHPCITGLRNTVRTCARYGITHLSLPLLLVDADLSLTHSSADEVSMSTVGHMPNVITMQSTQWYMRRAELVFKCVKGFLMEVAAYGSTSDITRQQVSSTRALVVAYHYAATLYNRVYAAAKYAAACMRRHCRPFSNHLPFGRRCQSIVPIHTHCAFIQARTLEAINHFHN
jgi:hypothetical protein